MLDMSCLQQGTPMKFAALPSQLNIRTAWPSQWLQYQSGRNNCRRARQTTSNSSKADAAFGDGQQPHRQHDESVKDRKKLWKAAIKLPMYSVGVVPVMVGAAAAYYEQGAVPWLRIAGLLGGALCVIAWLNLSNDAFDASTGVDVHKAESVVNLTGNRAAVLLLSALFLVFGAGLLGTSIAAAADGRVAAMLATAIACGYVYQGPPFRLSYKGLGEPLCFWAFGPLATTAFYLACQAAPSTVAYTAAAGSTATGAAHPAIPVLAGVSGLLQVLSVVVGITTTVILFCSHWHQIQGDLAAGKMSPLVRLGTARACKVLVGATASPYLILLGAAAAGTCPLPLLAAVSASIPAAKALLDYAWANHTVAADIAPLKKYGIKWHISMAAALTVGLVATRLL